MGEVKKIEDGGPAFPCEQGVGPDGVWNQTFDPGMSLRDWFAGKELVAMGTWCPNDPLLPSGQQPSPRRRAELRAGYAYMQADAMLKARARGENQG